MTEEPVTFWTARIRIWTPLDPRDPCIAKIGSESPLLFTGPTPASVRRAAEDFRASEQAKIEARKAASEERARKRRGEA